MKYVFALVLAGCIPGWQQLSPADAYRIESDRCAAKKDSEEVRKCQAMVDRKYGQYLNEGGYPGPSGRGYCGPPSSPGCGGSR